jgi:uncharacterized membrane protein
MSVVVTSQHPFPIPVRERLEAFPRSYELEDLGEVGAGEPLLPVALSDNGVLVLYGHAPDRPGQRATLRAFTQREGELQEHGGTVGGVPVAAVAGTGLLAGQRRVPGEVLHAWASHRGNFGARLWPEQESAATGVNSVGEVTGHLTVLAEGRARRRVFLHDGGEPRFMPVAREASAHAFGLNDSGTVAANCQCGLFETESEIVLWWGDAVTRVRGERGGGIWGVALTAGGRLCGRLRTPQGNLHAFLHEDGRTYDLNPTPAHQTEALAANDQRVVVGRSMNDSGQREAFRWTPRDGLQPLRTLVRGAAEWALHKAVAVNAAGWIVGTGLRDGALRGFLLRPS